MGLKDSARGKCITCERCIQKSTGSLYCEYYREYMKINDPSGTCYGYREAIFRNDRDIEHMIYLYGKYYVLTRINNILHCLGIQTNPEILNSFEYLYETVLPQMNDGEALREKYEIIGPMIADKLDSDISDKEKRAALIAELGIIYLPMMNKFHELVILKQYDEAIDLYKEMIQQLMTKYNLNNVLEKPMVRRRVINDNASKNANEEK